MKKGDTVMVYEDPLTEQKPEGEAVLLKRQDFCLNGMERWQVRFVSDGFVCDRNVKT